MSIAHAKHLRAAAFGCAAGLAALPAAWSHGAPEYPISRQYSCYQNRQQPACVAAVADGGEQALYDWNGVNQAEAFGNHMTVLKDGQICAGGQTKFKGFDLARSDWATNTWSPGTNGLYEFRYYATAPHRTSEWQFYLTKSNWKPGVAPLKWSDLELAATVGPDKITTTTDKRYVMQLSLPQRSGSHVLVAAWQRSDSGEAFYSCSDVNFGGGSTATPPVVASSLRQIGQLSAQTDLTAGTQARLRVFGADGADLETQVLTVTAGNGGRAAWLAQLARLVNSRSAYVRVGDLQGGNVTVPADATVMQVYALQAKPTLSHALDIVLPPKAPTTPAAPVTPVTPVTQAPGAATPPAATESWAEGKSFQVGQVVRYKGADYTCLQRHTAWAGAGWYPDAPSVLNVLWKRR